MTPHLIPIDKSPSSPVSAPTKAVHAMSHRLFPQGRTRLILVRTFRIASPRKREEPQIQPQSPPIFPVPSPRHVLSVVLAGCRRGRHARPDTTLAEPMKSGEDRLGKPGEKKGERHKMASDAMQCTVMRPSPAYQDAGPLGRNTDQGSRDEVVSYMLCDYAAVYG